METIQEYLPFIIFAVISLLSFVLRQKKKLEATNDEDTFEEMQEKLMKKQGYIFDSEQTAIDEDDPFFREEETPVKSKSEIFKKRIEKSEKVIKPSSKKEMAIKKRPSERVTGFSFNHSELKKAVIYNEILNNKFIKDM